MQLKELNNSVVDPELDATTSATTSSIASSTTTPIAASNTKSSLKNPLLQVVQ